MHTHLHPIVIPLHRPWLNRLGQDMVAAWRRVLDRAAERRAVCLLSARTLEDIGAPEHWRPVVDRCRAGDPMDRALQRIGVVPGSHW
jgi:hypothetical protein